MQIHIFKKFTGRRAWSISVTFVLTLLLAICGLTEKGEAETKTVFVDCDNGGSIGNALQLGAEWKAIIITVKGTCYENVTIQRDDVALQGYGDMGGTVTGANPGHSTIQINGARRITIENLHLTAGKSSGIVGFNGASFTVNNSTVDFNGESGVAVILNSSAIIDDVEVRENGRNGLYVEDSDVTIMNCIIEDNNSSGIRVTGTAHARIGINIIDDTGSNTINGNSADGISVYNCADAFIYGNEISENGGSGVDIANASARLVGKNTISGNRANGVTVHRGGMLMQGRGDFAITPNHDSITENIRNGIAAFNNATLDIQDATISSNGKHGIALDFHSTLRIFNSEITGNEQDGIILVRGSGLVMEYPPISVSDNGLYNIECREWATGWKSNIDGNASGVDGKIENCAGY